MRLEIALPRIRLNLLTSMNARPRRAFAAWTGTVCCSCGLPELLHGAECEPRPDDKEKY